MALHIIKAGPLTTLQDLGRQGYQRFGINTAGAMDPMAAALCWQLLEQAPNQTPLIEIPLGGLAVQVDAAQCLAWVSTGFRADIEDEALGASGRITLQPGQTMNIKPGAAGQFAYLGLAAEWSLQPVLGAWATHLRSGLGPAGALSAGDHFDVAPQPALPERLGLPALDYGAQVLRAIDGPQLARFSAASVERFFSQSWRVDAASDRMASALIGDRLDHLDGFDILSDGIAAGSVQVPGSGQPFILMADRGTTGGYPKIATVISADLPVVAQTRPGHGLQFQRCSLAEASAARRARIESGARWLRQSGSTLDSAQLLALNLISGVVSGS